MILRKSLYVISVGVDTEQRLLKADQRPGGPSSPAPRTGVPLTRHPLPWLTHSSLLSISIIVANLKKETLPPLQTIIWMVPQASEIRKFDTHFGLKG